MIGHILHMTLPDKSKSFCNFKRFWAQLRRLSGVKVSCWTLVGARDLTNWSELMGAARLFSCHKVAGPFAQWTDHRFHIPQTAPVATWAGQTAFSWGIIFGWIHADPRSRLAVFLPGLHRQFSDRRMPRPETALRGSCAGRGTGRSPR